MENSKLFKNQLRKIRKENIECLWEELTEDFKVVMTSEAFNLLSSVINVWRGDLKEKMIILTDDVRSLSKAEPAALNTIQSFYSIFYVRKILHCIRGISLCSTLRTLLILKTYPDKRPMAHFLLLNAVKEETNSIQDLTLHWKCAISSCETQLSPLQFYS